jgi:hypothetical protein
MTVRDSCDGPAAERRNSLARDVSPWKTAAWRRAPEGRHTEADGLRHWLKYSAAPRLACCKVGVAELRTGI